MFKRKDGKWLCLRGIFFGVSVEPEFLKIVVSLTCRGLTWGFVWVLALRVVGLVLSLSYGTKCLFLCLCWLTGFGVFFGGFGFG